jgi:hypothetical protein
MIEKPNIVNCAASIVMGAAGAVNFQNGCVIARTGAGTYTVTMDQGLALGSAVPIVTLVTAALVAQAFTVTQTSATVWTISTAADIAGAAADVVGTLVFICLAIGAPGTTGN